MIDRYYRALQLVTAHPTAIRLADKAKVHLWAYYGHVFDGLAHPPRLNHLAVIRWRSRSEEQAALAEDSVHSESRRSLVKSVRKPGAAWQVTISDVENYKACGGIVRYFIPPAQQSQPSLHRVETASSTSVQKPPSVTTSTEKPKKVTPTHISHRHHQSLNHLHLPSALKMPFDKIGSIAKRRGTGNVTGQDSDSQVEEAGASRTERMFRRDTEEGSRARNILRGIRPSRHMRMETGGRDTLRDKQELLDNLTNVLARERELVQVVPTARRRVADAEADAVAIEKEIYAERKR